MSGKMRGLSFCDEMVRAWRNTKIDTWPPEPIDGTKPFKAQTRRLIGKATKAAVGLPDGYEVCLQRWKDGTWEVGCTDHEGGGWMISMWKPAYQPGSVVYIREALRVTHDGRHAAYRTGDTLVQPVFPNGRVDGRLVWGWKRDFLPAMFMPKVAAREFGLVREVRVERVQEIGAADVQREGFILRASCKWVTDAYRDLWNGLHPKPPHDWASNPWVAVYTVQRIDRPEAGSQ